jgi:hypothetical protein
MKSIQEKLMSDLRSQLVNNHGEDIVQCYESYFPGELNLFDERFCGHINNLKTWAQGCLESMYDGFDDDVIPSLESFLAMEFSEYYIYDEDLHVGFLNR